MRISTPQFYARSVNAMLDQQSALSRIQNQVATGKRVNTPADDPVAAVHILELERAQSENDQFTKNSNIIRGRLNLEEQSLADVGLLIQNVREQVVQAASTASLSNSDRESIAISLQARLDELRDIANRKDGNGEYLFSGYSTLTQPFNITATSTVYQGDQGNRQVQVGPTQKLADGHSGEDVFMNIRGGNGVFTTAATSTNTGSGQVTVGTVVDRSSWVADDYTITFTPTADAYEIRDSGGTLVTSGAYTSGAAIEFNGVRVNVSGTPALGDTFSVLEAQPEDAFTTLQKLVDALGTPSGSPDLKAQLATTLGNSLQQLDQVTDHMLNVRSQIGARLSTLDDADSARDVLSVDLKTSLSDLRDLDYAQALTQMNQQLVGLQAAQMSYSKIAQLSLFNYLT